MTRLPPFSPRLDEGLAAEFMAHTLALLDFPTRQDEGQRDAAIVRFSGPEPQRDPDLPLLTPKVYPKPESSMIEAVQRVLIPPRPIDGLVGRKAETDAAVLTLLSGHPLVVSGGRGTGKTALLRQIANDIRIRQSFKRVWWLDNLENAETILGLALNAPGILRSEGANQPRLIREFLIANSTLLIIDQVSEAEVAKAIDFAPGIAIGSPDFESGLPVYHIHLQGLPAENGSELLARLSGLGESGAQPLAALVGNVPSAIRMVAAMIAEDGLAPQTIIDFIQNAGEDQGNQLAALYTASFEALPKDYQALCQALAAVPGRWIALETALSGYDKPLVGQRTLTFLERRGFIERQEGNVRTVGSWTENVTAIPGFKPIPHPVTRYLSREKTEGDGQSDALQAEGIAFMEEGNDERAKTALTEALRLRLDQGTDHAIAETLTALARLAYLNGDDTTAMRRLEEAAERLHVLRDDDSLEVVRIALSRAYRRAGRYDAALALLGDDANEQDLVAIYRARRDWNEAIKVYRRWVESDPEAVYGFAETLALAGRLPEAFAALAQDTSFQGQWLTAQFHQMQGELDEALKLYHKLRPDVPQALRAQFARAHARALAASGQFCDAGRIAGAEGVWYEARNYRPIFARQRASYALAAYCYYRCGQLDDAEGAARQVTRIEGERPDPLSEAIAQCVLAQIAWKRGELDSALAAFEAELTLRSALGIRDDHETGCILHDIATVFWEHGEGDRAVANYRRAVSFKDYTRDYRSVLITRMALREALIALGRYADAAEVGQVAVELVTQRVKTDLPTIGYVLANQAFAVRQADRGSAGDSRTLQLLNEWALRLAQRRDEALDSPDWRLHYLIIWLYIRTLPGEPGAADESGESGLPVGDDTLESLLQLAHESLRLAEEHAPETLLVVSAAYGLGALYLRFGQWAEAYETLQAIAPQVETLAQSGNVTLALATQLGLARASARLGNVQDAIEHFDRAIAYQADRHAQGLLVRETGNLYHQSGDDEGAAERYVRALELLNRETFPTIYVDTIVVLAYTRLRLRAFSEAIETFEQALGVVKELPKADPQLMSSVLYDMASAHYTLGQYRGAATTYQRALEYLDPKKDAVRLVDTLTALAHCYVELESYQQALESFHDALQIDDTSAAQRRMILAEQAEIFIRIGLVQSAIDAYRAALALEGASAVELAALHRGLGTLYVQLDMNPKAQKHFESALAAIQDEQSGATLRSLGDVYRAQNKLPEAADAYSRAITRLTRGENPVDLAATRRSLGQIYIEFGQLDDALINLIESLDVEKALSQQDGGRIVNTLRSLSQAHELSGDLDSAIRRYHEALVYQDARYTPEGYVDSLRELGRLYSKQRRYDEAAKAYEEALGTEANLPLPDTEKVNGMTNALADVYRAQGRLEAAAKLYRQVMAVMQNQTDSISSSAASAVASRTASQSSSQSPAQPSVPLVKEVAAALQLTESDIDRHIQTLKAADQSWQLLNRGSDRGAKPDLKSLAFVRALQAQTCDALGRREECQRFLDQLVELLKARRAELKTDDSRPALRSLALLLQGIEFAEAGNGAEAQEAYRQALETVERDSKANPALAWAIRHKVASLA